MGKVVRLRGVKGKRWGKGQSSSSNPQTKRHRLVARGKFGDHLAQANTQNSQNNGVVLTKRAVATHDANGGEEDNGRLSR